MTREGKGEKRRRSPRLLSVGGLGLVEVTGAAVGIVVGHVDGGPVQVEVSAA